MKNLKIFTNDIEKTAIDQINELMNQKAYKGSKVRIMPDVHSGVGCVIGTTMTLTEKVCPSLVGVDIGCGMKVINLGLATVDIKTLDEACHKVSSGFDVNNIDDATIKTFYQKNKWNKEWFENLKCYENLHKIERLYSSMGTLGGGNHFIELNQNKNNEKLLVIHSGSRNLGVQVAKYYQQIAIINSKNHDIEKKELIEKLKNEGRNKDISSELKNFSKKFPIIKENLTFLEGNELNNYFHDMKLCQEYASLNRKILSELIIWNYNNIMESKGVSFSSIINVGNEFETIHNYIDFKYKILRKGSVSAQLGEKLIIPLNMRDGSLICTGLGNEDWNFSAPHGAGRVLSRSQAFKQINLNDFQESMKNVYSTTVCKETIDESPFAYKKADSIIKLIDGKTVNVLEVIKPIYNFKSISEQPIWNKKKKN